MKRLALVAFAVAASNAFAGSLEAEIGRIIDIGKNRSQAYSILKTMTGKFGPRLTGSPASLQASEWAVEQFKRFGCTNVHLEQWGEMPVGFQRGKRQSAKMVVPTEKDMVFTTPSWSMGTNGPLRGRVVREPRTMEEFETVKDQLKGAWVLMNGRAGMRANTIQPESEQAKIAASIDAAGIHGKVFGTNDERVHTFGRFTDLDWNNLPKERRVIIRKSDYMSAFALLTIGQKVEFEFDIENKWYKGPIKLYNVIADIKGTEKPDEMIIICGHLDSWDGPGSVGANDNGTGTSVAIEAARILTAAKVKPKRTIRFILWTGEEQGLLGSRAYVEKYKADMKKVSAVLNDDGGTNYQGGYRCLPAHKPILDAAIAPVQAAFPDLPMSNDEVASFPAGGSSDHAPFVWAGVPGFFTKESGRADYGFVWHTQNDRPEHSIAEYMAQSATNHAAVSYYLAQHPELLAHFDPPRTGGGGRPQGNARNYGPWFDHQMEHHMNDDGTHNHDHGDDWWDYVVFVLKQGVRGLQFVP